MTAMTMAAAPRRSAPLFRFLLLSLILHASLLLSFGVPFSLSGHKQTVLTVSLKPPAITPGTGAQVQSKGTPASHRNALFTKARPANNRIHTKQNGQRPGHRQQATMRVSSASSSNDGTKLAKARIQAYLMTHMARYFSYPVIARRRGWQGRVLLGFDVTANGSISNVHIDRSSGYAVLDRSAVESLNRIDHISQARHWLQGRQVALQLPVIYRLESP